MRPAVTHAGSHTESCACTKVTSARYSACVCLCLSVVPPSLSWYVYTQCQKWLLQVHALGELFAKREVARLSLLASGLLPGPVRAPDMEDAGNERCWGAELLLPQRIARLDSSAI